MAKKKATKKVKASKTVKKTQYVLEALNVQIKNRTFLKEQNYVFEPDGKDLKIKDEILAAVKRGYLKQK